MSLRSLFCLFLSGRFTQVLLYSMYAKGTKNVMFEHKYRSRQEAIRWSISSGSALFSTIKVVNRKQPKQFL